MSKIAIITGSTRAPRVGPKVAKWVSEVLQGRPSDSIELETLQVSDYNLPMFDEPIVPMQVPAQAQYTKEHTKKWSAAVAAYAGFIFVTPEYNGSIPASLKNAIDYLYHEWADKPAIIVSYGARGGTRAAGHLGDVLGVVRVATSPTKTHLAFTKPEDQINALAKGTVQDSLKEEWVGLGHGKTILQAWAELKASLDQKANSA